MLGDYLKAARGARSQGEVAAKISMEQAEWSKWETGKRYRPSPQLLQQFAHALGVPLGDVARAYAGEWPYRDEANSEPLFWEVVKIPPDTDQGQKELLQAQIAGIGPVLLQRSQRWAHGELGDGEVPVPPQPLPAVKRRATSRSQDQG